MKTKNDSQVKVGPKTSKGPKLKKKRLLQGLSKQEMIKIESILKRPYGSR